MFHSGGNGGNDVGICVSENWRIAGRYDKGSDFETGRDSFVYCFLLCSQSECLRLLSEDISEADQYTAEEDVFDAVLDQDMIQFTSNNSGMYLSILNNDVTNLENNYFAKIPEIIQRSFVFLGCLAVLCSYDGRVAGMVLLTVWIPVAVPFLFGNVISEAEGRFYRNLEQYTGKLKDFFGGFEVIQCFQIGKETEELFGSCVKDVEESRYHSRFCESSGEVFALSLTYGTLFFQILFCAWTAAKGKVSANAMLSILYLLSSINNPVQNAVQAFLSVKSAGPNVEKVEKLLAKPKKRTHPSVDRK